MYIGTLTLSAYKGATVEIPQSSTPGLTSDLRDLRDVPLADVAESARAGEAALEETLRRIAPQDGSRVLLVAASFNSAI
jgi:FXSXX-COOH protein